MLLSVIIPYFNADAWIGRMLDSLLDQGLDPSDYEIIIVDDESSQEPATLKDYASRYPQIRYHRISHSGMSLARNYGLSVATGEWIYFCDSDDFLQPQVMAGILRAARERDLEMIVARFVLINENDPVPVSPRRGFSAVSETMTGLAYLEKSPRGFTWAVWTQLVRRDVLQAHGLAFEDTYYVEDRLFKFALLQVVSRLATIDVDLYFYVQHESSVFHQKRQQDNPAFVAAWLRYMDTLASYVRRPDVSPQIVASLEDRLNRSAFYVLSNAFVFSPVAVNQSAIDHLAARRLYPVAVRPKDSRHVRRIKRMMNRRGLWLFLHRVFHLLPDHYIYKHFQV